MFEDEKYGKVELIVKHSVQFLNAIVRNDPIQI